MPQLKIIDNELTTFKIESHHPQWRLWIMATFWLLLVMFGVERYLHWYTITQIVPSYTEVDEFGIVHQSTDFTCVPAAFTTLLRQQGIQAEQREVTDALGTTLFGTWPILIPLVGKQHGYRVTHERLSFEELCASEEPMLLYNHFTEGLHVSYIPPGRMSPKLASTLFPNHPGPLLPVMDPIDGLVLVDKKGFAEYFDGGKPKEVYRFHATTQKPRPYAVDEMMLSGNMPLIKVNGWYVPE